MMKKFRKIVYSNSEEEAEEAYESVVDTFGDTYPNFKNYLKHVYEYRERWCICYRNDVLIRGNNTNNLVESQFLVLKDNVLNRTKEVSKLL